MLAWEIVESKFKIQSHFYFYFSTNIVGKSIESPPNYGLISGTTVQLQGWIRYWITHEGWYIIKQRNQTKPNLECHCLSNWVHLANFFFFFCKYSLGSCFLSWYCWFYFGTNERFSFSFHSYFCYIQNLDNFKKGHSAWK